MVNFREQEITSRQSRKDLKKPPSTTPSHSSPTTYHSSRNNSNGASSSSSSKFATGQNDIKKISLRNKIMVLAMLAMIMGMLNIEKSTSMIDLDPIREKNTEREVVPHKNNENHPGPVSGSTGERFSGIKVRTYNLVDRSLLRFLKVDIAPLQPSIFGRHGAAHNCLQWAVVTTIHVPNESIFGVSKLKNWCLVIVGDIITPDNHYEELVKKENVFFLSSIYQKKQLNSNPFIKLMPFKSFARKNIGYLFAINYGAKVIYDFDDDNILAPLEDNTTIPPPFLYRENAGFESTVLLKFVKESEQDDVAESLVFNPYAYMNASHTHSWPRGFPIDQLQKNFYSWDSTDTTVGDIKYSSIGVIQSLCNGDPDNDAVFRLTRSEATKFTFERSKTTLPLLVPASMYSPYNAQATTHLYSAFWGLYLPISVPGRVTDIWRSYITQRIMKEIGLHLMYTPPIVNHERSAHDYLADFEDESDLYRKTTTFILFLDNWSPVANTFTEIIFELWVALYEHDYIGLSDVEAIEEWLTFLLAIGYEFPSIQRQTKLSKAAAPAQSQPTLEGQPYRSIPNSMQMMNNTSVTRPKRAVLKLIMMTMDEWPLLKSWVLYHGHLLGFEHLYILDGSSDARCTAFLQYARDILGVNVIFTSSNLNQMESVMTDIAKEIAGSSNFIIKMDTDEFLVVHDDKTKMLTTSIFYYLDGLTLDGDSRIGYEQNSKPSKEVCSEDVYSTPDKFPLSKSKFIGKEDPHTHYKMVYNSNVPFGRRYGERIITLGGHAHGARNNTWTNLGIVHYRERCIEIHAENSKRVLVSHGYIQLSDTNEEVTTVLAARFKCATADICNTCDFFANFYSFHKAIFYLKWLNCPEKIEADYYPSRESLRQQEHKNTALIEAMQISHELFDL